MAHDPWQEQEAELAELPNTSRGRAVGDDDPMAQPALRLVHHRPPQTWEGGAGGPAATSSAATAGREQLSDEELLALTCAGEREAFRVLVERYEEKAIHTARAVVNSLDTAREVAQEAFLKVYANRERFDVRRKFSSWFYRILRNQAVDRARRQGSGTPGSAGEFAAEWAGWGPGPAGEASQRERRLAVHRILSDLPAKFREVLVLRDLDELSCGEIAQRVGTTPGTVRWRLHHARKLFRDQWERLLGKEEGDQEL